MKDDFPKDNRPQVLPPTPLRPPEVTPLEKLVEVHPSTKPIPQTTSQMIGWRSGERKLQLERYGGYAKGKGGLVKQLNWPMEGVI